LKRASFSPAARTDLRRAVEWLLKESPRAAGRLREAVSDAAERLGRHPLAGHVRPEVSDRPLRFLPMPGSSYVLIYLVRDGEAHIVRVLHGARDLERAFDDEA
jgi:plasmid stabilization system protein ParE